jgi:hypothetical protein
MLDSASNIIHENENRDDDNDVEQQQEQQHQQDNESSRPATVAAAARQLVLLKRASERMQKKVVQGTRTVVDGTRSISLSTQIAATAAAAQVMTVVNEIGSHPLEQQHQQQQQGDGKEGDEGENGSDDSGSGGVMVKGQDNDKWITKVHERGVFVIGIAAFMAACWSFIAVVGQLSDISSLTVLLLSPTVMIQKKKLNALGSLRSLHNELRNMAQRLVTENIQMRQSVNSMESHLQRLNTVESQLTSLAKDGKGGVERLVHVVEEHGQLQAELKRVLQADVTHQLFSALLASDVNGNYKLSHPDETSILEQRLLNVQGVIFSRENFRRLLQSSDGTFDLTLTDAANIARQLQRDDDIPDAEKVFIFRPLDTLKNNISSTLPISTATTTPAVMTTTATPTTRTPAAAATATAAKTAKPKPKTGAAAAAAK